MKTTISAMALTAAIATGASGAGLIAAAPAAGAVAMGVTYGIGSLIGASGI